MATATSSARENEAREIHENSQIEALSLEQQIRRRAHEIWLQRDGQEGSDVGDWLAAEKEISSR